MERNVEKISIHVPIAGNDDGINIVSIDPLYISIHVPIAGNDATAITVAGGAAIFQSTFPLQGTTKEEAEKAIDDFISIHVPIAGNDCQKRWLRWLRRYFNPRSHCRERQFSREMDVEEEVFQSTFPLQGTTSEAV